MTKSKFISIMKKAILETSKGSAGERYTCNILNKLNINIKRDYCFVYGKDELYDEPFYIPVGFQPEKVDYTEEEQLEVRLNALTMYMVQALEFETYKDL